MIPERLEAIRQVAENLRAEGQISRAGIVGELIAEVERLRALLGDSADDECLRAVLVKDEADLDYCRCGSYCGDTSPAIIDADITGASVEDLVAKAADLLPLWACEKSKSDALANLFIIGRDLSEEVREAFRARAQEARTAKLIKDKEAAAKKAADDRFRAIKRAEARVAELASGVALDAARADLAALLAGEAKP